jgi:hypothetical protein
MEVNCSVVRLLLWISLRIREFTTSQNLKVKVNFYGAQDGGLGRGNPRAFPSVS